MNYDLNRLRGDLQKLIAVNARQGSLTVDAALALIGTFMLQISKCDIKDWKQMVDYVSFLKNSIFKGKNKSKITELDFQECARYIYQSLLAKPIEIKNGSLVSLGLKVIADVSDEGFLSFNNQTFNAYASQAIICGKPAKLFLFDCEDDIIIDTDCTQDVIINTKEKKEVEGETYETRLMPRRSLRPGGDASNEPFELLYNSLIKQSQSGNRTKNAFAWQWLLTRDEYDKIKECIRSNDIPAHSKMSEQTAILLAMYIGEFYKREYENSLNPFKLIDKQLSSNFFNKLCKKLNINPYTKNNDIHRYSLYVRGGLPIHYLNSKLDSGRVSLFVEALSDLFSSCNDIDTAEGEDKLGKIDNTSLKESYHQGKGHSIYEYIQSIKNGKQTWDVSDKNHPDFVNIIEKIASAKQKANERRKFKLYYSLWASYNEKELKEFVITPQLRFNPEDEGSRHYAISRQRLYDWGIPSDLTQFVLKIDDEKLLFSWCFNGDYISRDLKDQVCLSCLNKDNLDYDALITPNINIECLIDNDRSVRLPDKSIYNPFKDGFLQFYTNDDPLMALWSSFKGGQSYIWSGLLFDKNRYLLLSTTPIVEINEFFSWTYFKDSVALNDMYKNKVRTIFNSKGRIYATVKDTSIHNLIENPIIVPDCLTGKMTECTIKTDKFKAYIVKSSNIEFDIFRVATDEQIDGAPYVEYKSGADYQCISKKWAEYNPSQVLDQGLYIFRISYARYSAEVRCFVMSPNASIESYHASHPNYIRFHGINDIVNLDGMRPQANQEQLSFNIFKDLETYNFEIGDENGKISLELYHPKPQTYVHMYGKPIESKSLFIAQRENISISCISSELNKFVKLSTNDTVHKVLFNALTATITNTNANAPLMKYDLSLIDEDIPNGALEIRIYNAQLSDTDHTDSLDLFFLDFENNEIQKILGNNPVIEAKEIAKKSKHDGLLFQSLKKHPVVAKYNCPKFISRANGGLANQLRQQERQNRLSEFAILDPPMFLRDYSFQQFCIACEHRLYFAIFDSLLSMCWDSKNNNFLSRTRRKFKNNIIAFLEGYIAFTATYDIEWDIAGLIRLSREFLFNWNVIVNDINKSNNQQLTDIYNQILNTINYEF